MYIYIYIYICIYILYIYTHLPGNAIVRLLHPRSGDSQGQETFLAPSADKQIRKYDTECSNCHPSVSIQRSKTLSGIYIYIYIYIYVYIYMYIYIYISIYIYIYIYMYIYIYIYIYIYFGMGVLL